ncbi:MAG: hypothetical protein ABTQ34_09180 [Bdellovibrionales bacterium]
MSRENIESILSELKENNDKPLPIIGRIIETEDSNPLQVAVGPSEREFGLLDVYGFVDNTICTPQDRGFAVLDNEAGTNRFTALICRHARQPMLMHLAVNRNKFIQLLNIFFRIRPTIETILDLRGNKEFDAVIDFGAHDVKERKSNQELQEKYMISREALFADLLPSTPSPVSANNLSHRVGIESIGRLES